MVRLLVELLKPVEGLRICDPTAGSGGMLIYSAFEAFEDQLRFAHVADLSEIEANDFNLNISRYVDTAVEEERLDVGEARAACGSESASATRRWRR